MTSHGNSPATRPLAGTARTLLFVPGTSPERFSKAAATAADLVVVDLEDAVPEEGKVTAREAVAAWLEIGGRAAVRVNGAASPHHDADVAALKGQPGLLAVVVPMAEGPGDLVILHDTLEPDVEIVALIETARGLTRAVDIASTAGVTRLAFGHLDFALDIDADTGDQAMLLARSTLVIASRVAGLPGPVDGVTTRLDDVTAAGADALRARRLGFTGKLCIHPRQVEAVNSAFSPSADDVVWARHILGHRTAGDAVRIGGQMVDAPVVLKAEAIMAKAGER